MAFLVSPQSFFIKTDPFIVDNLVQDFINNFLEIFRFDYFFGQFRKVLYRIAVDYSLCFEFFQGFFKQWINPDLFSFIFYQPFLAPFLSGRLRSSKSLIFKSMINLTNIIVTYPKKKRGNKTQRIRWITHSTEEAKLSSK